MCGEEGGGVGGVEGAQDNYIDLGGREGRGGKMFVYHVVTSLNSQLSWLRTTSRVAAGGTGDQVVERAGSRAGVTQLSAI